MSFITRLFGKPLVVITVPQALDDEQITALQNHAQAAIASGKPIVLTGGARLELLR
jgi:hypothetical protein